MNCVAKYLQDTGRPDLARKDLTSLIHEWRDFAHSLPSKAYDFASSVQVRQAIEDVLANCDPPIGTHELVLLKNADQAFRKATEECSPGDKAWWLHRKPR